MTDLFNRLTDAQRARLDAILEELTNRSSEKAIWDWGHETVIDCLIDSREDEELRAEYESICGLRPWWRNRDTGDLYEHPRARYRVCDNNCNCCEHRIKNGCPLHD